MNIKEKIGQRIRAARIDAGLSIQQLADKTENLQRRRISYYESGERMPGPLEVLQIAKVLNVSPAYMLCLSEDESLERYINKAIPILSLEEATNYKKILNPDFYANIKKHDHVIAEDKISENLGDNGFAVVIEDNSMAPEFNEGDLIIINPDHEAVPGKYVLAMIKDQNKAIFRKYRETRKSKAGETKYELEAINPDWPTIEISNKSEGKILGIMCEHRKYA